MLTDSFTTVVGVTVGGVKLQLDAVAAGVPVQLSVSGAANPASGVNVAVVVVPSPAMTEPERD